MKTPSMISKISTIVDKAMSPSLMKLLASAGIPKVFVETGRNSILRGREGFLSFRTKVPLAYDPVEIVSLFVEKDIEADLMSQIHDKLDLKTPGRGSVHSCDVTLLETNPEYAVYDKLATHNAQNAMFFNELMGIACVVQRGEGDPIARIALNTGSSVPVTTHGLGSGVRDKLGLLRITIPPEKEMVDLVMSKYDVNSVMEMFITAAKLDQPGRGIAYIYPVKQGTVNTKITRSKSDQAASMEQMVSAIDGIIGGIEWRKSRLESGSSNRLFLTGLVELDMYCGEGYGTELSCVAMESGAPGATISKLKYVCTTGEEEQNLPVREICKMIVPHSAVEPILKSLREEDSFGDKMKGMLCYQMVDKAFTYGGRR